MLWLSHRIGLWVPLCLIFSVNTLRACRILDAALPRRTVDLLAAERHTAPTLTAVSCSAGILLTELLDTEPLFTALSGGAADERAGVRETLTIDTACIEGAALACARVDTLSIATEALSCAAYVQTGVLNAALADSADEPVRATHFEAALCETFTLPALLTGGAVDPLAAINTATVLFTAEPCGAGVGDTGRRAEVTCLCHHAAFTSLGALSPLRAAVATLSLEADAAFGTLDVLIDVPITVIVAAITALRLFAPWRVLLNAATAAVTEHLIDPPVTVVIEQVAALLPLHLDRDADELTLQTLDLPLCAAAGLTARAALPDTGEAISAAVVDLTITVIVYAIR